MNNSQYFKLSDSMAHCEHTYLANKDRHPKYVPSFAIKYLTLA